MSPKQLAALAVEPFIGSIATRLDEIANHLLSLGERSTVAELRGGILGYPNKLRTLANALEAAESILTEDLHEQG
jgi:hypothetical protein